MPILAEMSKMCVHFTMALNFFETLLWSLFPINSMEGMTMTLQMKSSFTKKKKNGKLASWQNQKLGIMYAHP